MDELKREMKPGTRMHGPASLRLSYNTTVPAHMRGGLLELSHLIVPESHRRQGYASMLMQKVCAEADRAGKVLMLTVRPFDTIAMDAKQLTEWYGRYGFDVIQQSPVLMARPARAPMKFTPKPLAFSIAMAQAETVH
jgi:ribosomal protein S18 acetylase RimI-like enzyme